VVVVVVPVVVVVLLTLVVVVVVPVVVVVVLAVVVVVVVPVVVVVVVTVVVVVAGQKNASPVTTKQVPGQLTFSVSRRVAEKHNCVAAMSAHASLSRILLHVPGSGFGVVVVLVAVDGKLLVLLTVVAVVIAGQFLQSAGQSKPASDAASQSVNSWQSSESKVNVGPHDGGHVPHMALHLSCTKLSVEHISLFPKQFTSSATPLQVSSHELCTSSHLPGQSS